MENEVTIYGLKELIKVNKEIIAKYEEKTKLLESQNEMLKEQCWDYEKLIQSLKEEIEVQKEIIEIYKNKYENTLEGMIEKYTNESEE